MLDENVPASVASMLQKHDHEVEWIRDYVPPGSPDPLVATVSEKLNAILVSFDRDFKKIAPRIPYGQRTRFKNLSRIWLKCSEPQAAARLELVLSFVESEHALAQHPPTRPMHLTIGKSWLRTER